MSKNKQYNIKSNNLRDIQFQTRISTLLCLPDPHTVYRLQTLKVDVIHVTPLIPLEAYYLLLNVRSKSQIIPQENLKYKISSIYYALSSSVTCTTSIYYALVVVSRIQFISNLQQKIMHPSDCRKIHTHQRQLCANIIDNMQCSIRKKLP